MLDIEHVAEEAARDGQAEELDPREDGAHEGVDRQLRRVVDDQREGEEARLAEAAALHGDVDVAVVDDVLEGLVDLLAQNCFAPSQ